MDIDSVIETREPKGNWDKDIYAGMNIIANVCVCTVINLPDPHKTDDSPNKVTLKK